MKQHQRLVGHFEAFHKNPPQAFNPDFDPNAKEWSRIATESMERDDYYRRHSREQCRIEWRRRFDLAKLGYEV